MMVCDEGEEWGDMLQQWRNDSSNPEAIVGNCGASQHLPALPYIHYQHTTKERYKRLHISFSYKPRTKERTIGLVPSARALASLSAGVNCGVVKKAFKPAAQQQDSSGFQHMQANTTQPNATEPHTTAGTFTQQRIPQRMASTIPIFFSANCLS